MAGIECVVVAVVLSSVLLRFALIEPGGIQ